MGRNRVPDEIKRMRGNPRKEFLPPASPGAAADPAAVDSATAAAAAEASPAYDVPEWLADDAAEIFAEIADRFLPKNILQPSDFNALARFAVAMASYIKNYKAVQEAGGEFYLSESKHGKFYRTLPAVMRMERAELVLVRLEVQLGLTPAARQSILARMRGLGGFDPWAGLPLGDAAREGLDVHATDSSAADAGGEGGAAIEDGSPIGLLQRAASSPSKPH